MAGVYSISMASQTTLAKLRLSSHSLSTQHAVLTMRLTHYHRFGILKLARTSYQLQIADSNLFDKSAGHKDGNCKQLQDVDLQNLAGG